MILVTGAAGKTGRAVVAALAGRGQVVRALVRRPEQQAPALEHGAQYADAGDMRDAAVLRGAMAGAQAVYHICPNVSPDEAVIGKAAIAAARDLGLGRFVYHSVLHPQTEAMPHHWLKLRVEELLFASGLDYTILQPAAYMQNVLAHWAQIVSQGAYPIPYPAETRIGMVDLQDVAEVAATVLIEQGHGGATYELAGPEPLTQAEVAAILAEKLGRVVQIQPVPLDAWESMARTGGMTGYALAALSRMFQYYARHGFWGNPRVLGWLLARPPTTFAEFVARTLQGE